MVMSQSSKYRKVVQMLVMSIQLMTSETVLPSKPARGRPEVLVARVVLILDAVH